MRSGLTRIELVVIVIIVGGAALLLVPFVLHQRTQARRTLCEDRLRRLGQAAAWHDEQEGRLPGYRDRVRGDQITSWVTRVLPYLTTSDPAGDTPFHNAYEAVEQDRRDGLRLPELRCPAQVKFRSQEAPLSYIANCGLADRGEDLDYPPDWPSNGVFFDVTLSAESQRVTMTLKWLSEHDGTNVTLLLSESTDAHHWTESHEADVGFLWAANEKNGEPTPLPDVLPINARRGESDGTRLFARPASEHTGGVNGVMASGETRFISEQIDYLVFQRLMTAAGAEVKAANRDEPLPPPWRHGE
jgi:hypothetical protein